MPPSGQRLARPERVAVVAEADPGAIRPSSASSARPRSSGVVTLRFIGSPGIAWTGILQASRRAASSVKVRAPLAGKRSSAASSRLRRAPCGVWATPSPARSTVAPIQPSSIRLTGLDDGHDRDGRPVLRGGPGDGADQLRRDRRPATVVDEHDPIVPTDGLRRPDLGGH